MRNVHPHTLQLLANPIMLNPNEKIEPVNVAEEVSRSFLDYSMSVIISRALPSISSAPGEPPMTGSRRAGSRSERYRTSCGPTIIDRQLP